MKDCLRGKKCGKSCIKKTKKCWKYTNNNKKKKKKSAQKSTQKKKSINKNNSDIHSIDYYLQKIKNNNLDYCIDNNDCPPGEQCYGGTCSDFESVESWKHDLSY